MATESNSGWLTRHGNIYFYVPNLIGYVRVALMLSSFAMAPLSPLLCIIPYAVGFAMDELDGRFARMLNQTSTFGQVLDMVTDRVATTGLLALLCYFVPQLQSIWLVLISLDLGSHWFQMYAALACGASTHKDTGSSNPMIKLYYTSRIFMGYCCVSCEFLYLSVYAATRTELASLALPGTEAASKLLPSTFLSMALSTKDGLLLYSTVIMLLAMPGVAVKQVVNVLQLVTSVQKLVDLDTNPKKTR